MHDPQLPTDDWFRMQSDSRVRLVPDPPPRPGPPPTQQAKVDADKSDAEDLRYSIHLPDLLPFDFGRYRLLKCLGKGGMGAVYLAHDKQLDRRVALKIPNMPPDDNPEVRKRFFREARAAATLTHPNLCPVHDVGEIDGMCYLSMAFIEGQPLSERVQTKGRLTPTEAVTLVRKLALALEDVHQHGIIHRDLKPANVMLDGNGEPIVMDFGLARRRHADDNMKLTKDGVILGTPAYMSPEQASGDMQEVGTASDIYSLGVILYELLTGSVPFDGPMGMILAQILRDPPPPLTRYRPDLDPALEAICLKCLAKLPADRYPTMAAFAGELEDWLVGKLRPRPWYRRRGVIGGSLAATAGLLTAAAVVAWYVTQHAPVAPTEKAQDTSVLTAKIADTAPVEPVVEDNDENRQRRPEPDKAAQARAERRIRDDLFKADYPQLTVLPRAARTDLAHRLHQEALKTKDRRGAALHFVLLREARRLAVLAADAQLALIASNDLALEYAVGKPLRMKVETLQDIGAELAKPWPDADAKRQAYADWAAAAFGLMGEAVGAEHYDLALDLLKLAEKAGAETLNNDLIQQVRTRRTEVTDLQQAADRVKEASDKLIDNPNLPDANFIVGKYRCLTRGQWDKGLPLLAKGSDPQWKMLAEQDLAKPSDAEGCMTVADNWWQLAQSEKGRTRAWLYWRACVWYEQALPKLGDTERTEVEQKLALVQGAPDLKHVTPLMDADLTDKATNWPTAQGMGYADGRWFMHRDNGWFPRTVTDCPSGFACQVTGRVLGAGSPGWHLTIMDYDWRRDVTISIDSDGVMHLALPFDQDKQPVRPMENITHRAIRSHDETNTLLVVLRGRHLEIYVNGVAVREPLLLEHDVAPGHLRLGVGAGMQGGHADFERFTVWPAEKVPTLESRMAGIKAQF